MSVITGKIDNEGYLVDVFETEVECPICTFKFDASEKMAKAKLPAKACCRLGIRITNVQHLNKSSK